MKHAVLMLGLLASFAVPAQAQPTSTSEPANVLSVPGTACNGKASVTSAVELLVAGGAKRIFIPRGCIYVPVDNTTPPGVELIGEDWNSSILSVRDRATDFLSLGPHSTLRNMAIISHFCDIGPDPANTAKVCPVGEARNIGDTPQGLSNWVYQPLFLISGTQSTGPTGIVSKDTPLIGLLQNTAGGDGLYAASSNNASAIRVVTAGLGDNGILLLNGFYGPAANPHHGLLIKDFSNGTGNGEALRITRVGDHSNVGTSLRIDDREARGEANGGSFVDISVEHQATGAILKVKQGGTDFTGDILAFEAGSRGSTFSGNFLDFRNHGTSVLRADAAGHLHVASLSVAGAGTMGTGSANAIEWSGGAAGAAPSLAATGQDAQVALRLAGKSGAGVLTGLFVAAGDPEPTDVLPGYCVDWHNTVAGTVTHVCNVNGALRSLSMQ